MVWLSEVVDYCNQLLDCTRHADYCPNGLQVESGDQVHRLVTGVTASQATIDAAVAAGADLLLVHHGYFWKGEAPCLTGMKGRRISTLIRHGVSLLAYHLPLDAHPTLGNNHQLGLVLGFQDGRATPDNPLLWVGEVPDAPSLDQLAAEVGERLGRLPLAVSGSGRPVRRIAWCTGAAQDLIGQAAELRVDAFLSGEISERTVHAARELGVHYLAAGHHGTERYGVQALGAHLADRFGVEHQYLEQDNPV